MINKLTKFNIIALILRQIVLVLLAIIAQHITATAGAFVVTNTNTSGAGSFRAAIISANAAAGASTINFNIPGSGVHVIALTGNANSSATGIFPAITKQVTIDGYTQTGSAAGPISSRTITIVLDGSALNDAFGYQQIGIEFTTGSSGSILRGLNIRNFYINDATNYTLSNDAIEVTGANNVFIHGNYIGTNETGTTIARNGEGILTGGNSDNVVIGTNGDGTNDAQEGNLISGNGQVDQGFAHTGSGVNLGAFGGDCDNNVVAGNYIGTDRTGTSALANVGGVYCNYTCIGAIIGNLNNTVSPALCRNIISGNEFQGVESGGSGSPTINNKISGNYIGTTYDGIYKLGNGGCGIRLVSLSGHLVGTDGNGVNDANERNVISGNGLDGVWVLSNTCIVAGNTVGLNVNYAITDPNNASMKNARDGINISANDNIVGTNGNNSGDLIERNISSNNGRYGIYVTKNNNIVANNYVGTGPLGSESFGNTYDGIILEDATNTRVGTNSNGVSDALERNVTVNNGGSGVYISNYSTSGNTGNNLVAGNYIGVYADGTTSAGNNSDEIGIYNSATNKIGGTATGSGNIIANSIPGYADGIYVSGSVSVDNSILGNSIYSNGNLGINLGGGTQNSYGVTANDNGDADAGPNDLQNYLLIDSVLSTTQVRVFWNGNNSLTRFEFFENTIKDASLFGEGRTYLGAVETNLPNTGCTMNTITCATCNFTKGSLTLSSTATEVLSAGTTYASTSEFSGYGHIDCTPFGPIMISGNVYNDANGLSGTPFNTVDGTLMPGSSVNVLLVNSSNQVILSTPLLSNGSYNFTDLIAGNYNVILSNTLTVRGTTSVTTASFPANYVATGENIGATAGNDGTVNGILPVTLTSSNRSNLNFGIEQLPTADTKSYTVGPSAFSGVPPVGYPTISGYKSIPASSSSLTGYAMGGSLTGSDMEDCTTSGSCNSGKTFRFSSVNANTQVYYDNGSGPVLLTPGTNITNFNPALLVIYGQNGSGSGGNPAGFTYALVDNAGLVGTAVAYSIINTIPLPVHTFDLTGNLFENKVILKWNYISTVMANSFIIQRAGKDNNWSDIGTLTADHAITETPLIYTYADDHLPAGNYYYRILALDKNGASGYSKTLNFDLLSSPQKVNVIPNPAASYITLSGEAHRIAGLYIYDLSGKKAVEANDVMSDNKISIETLSPGSYLVEVINTDHTREYSKLIKR